MARINNTDTVKEIIEGAKIQTSSDDVPQQLAKSVVPVMEVNPKMLRLSTIRVTGDANNATSATLMTTSTIKDFYVTGFSLGIIKDATSESVYSSIKASINNISAQLITIPSITLTAQSDTISVSLNHPIKLDRGTTVTVTNTNATANIRAMAVLYGYEVED